MESFLYPVFFFSLGGGGAYVLGRRTGFVSVGVFVTLALIGYGVCALSLVRASGPWAGVAEIAIAIFVITPVLAGALVGGVVGGYHKQRKMIERLNDK